MITKKKKIIILSVMVALLVLTGFLNLTLNNHAAITTGGQETNNASFFETYRVDRDASREQQSLYYKAILESQNATEEAKTQAQTNLDNLAGTSKKELALESLILAKGFEDVVVSFTENYVNVMVKAKELTEAEVAQIVDVVQKQTQKSIDNIKIIPVE